MSIPSHVLYPLCRRALVKGGEKDSRVDDPPQEKRQDRAIVVSQTRTLTVSNANGNIQLGEGKSSREIGMECMYADFSVSRGLSETFLVDQAMLTL